MSIEHKLETLENEKKELEELLEFQHSHIYSKFEPELEDFFWKDRQSRIIHMIVKATKPICVFYTLFMCISLLVNYLSADTIHRFHDMTRNLISFGSTWASLIVTFIVARTHQAHKFFIPIMATVICIGLVLNLSMHLSMLSLPLAWRGTIVMGMAIVFVYICSGVRPKVTFFSSMLASLMSYIYLKYNYSHVPLWVISNTLILPNLVGLALSVLSIFNERIRFLQSLIIECDKKIYSLMNQNLTEISYQDSLTHLRNRRGFESLMKNMMFQSKTIGNKFAILFIDVDYFKLYNDQYGHDAGDKALINIAQILTEKIRKNDIAMRFGGEEFIILLEDTSLEMSEDIAKRILDAVTKANIPHQASPIAPHLTVSIGLTMYAWETLSFTEVLQCADQALYAAKNQGRNQFQIYTFEDFQPANL